MKKEQKEELKKKAEESQLWILEMMVSKQNKLLQDLAGQGVLSNDNRWRKLVLKRNIYRKELIKKLNDWISGKLKDDSNPSYADYINSLEHNKFGEEG